MVAVVDGHRRVGAEEVDVVVGDPAFDGSLVEEVREDLDMLLEEEKKIIELETEESDIEE